MGGVLERALADKQKLEMVYIDNDGQITQRIVRLVAVRKETVLAYCYWRKRVRSFKRENILSAYPCKDKKVNMQSS